MTEEIKNQNEEVVEEVKKTEAESNSNTNDFKRGRGFKKGGSFSRGGGRARGGLREKPEFDSKTIEVRRVTRVVSGGRRYSLAIAVAAGDRKGKIGFGTGKGIDTQAAIDKGFRSARKNMITLNLTKDNSIPYEVEAKYKSAKIWLTPNRGKGVVAGSSARAILDLAGLNNVTAKFHSGTKNKMNNAKATIKALAKFAK